jgi:hypothetical protein
MNNSLRISIAICVFLALFCYACASRPDEQIKAATEAFNQAAELHADQYVPGDWKGAKELWDQAQDQLAKQQYGLAGETFLRAKARLLKVRDEAKTERESMQTQVKNMQENIAANYAAFKAAMPPAKQAGPVKKEFQTACADIDKRIELINSQMGQGDFIGAKANAQGALQSIEYNHKKLAGGATKGR